MAHECPPEFFTERKVRRTRKPHRCYETRWQIPVGTPATIITGKWDGEVRSMYMAPGVYELWSEVDRKYRQEHEDLNFGDLHEHFANQEQYNPDDPLLARWRELKARIAA